MVALTRDGTNIRGAGEHRPADVISVATEMFLERGYSGTTMEAIAKAAGVAKKTIYATLGDKEAVFALVANYLLRGQHVPLESPDPNLPLAMNLRRFAREVLEGTFERVSFGLMRLLQQEGHRFPELVRILEKTHTDGLVLPLTAFFRKQHEQGTIRYDDPVSAAQIFIFMMYGDLSRRLLLQKEPPSRKELAEYADLIVNVFLSGVGCPSAP